MRVGYSNSLSRAAYCGPAAIDTPDQAPPLLAVSDALDARTLTLTVTSLGGFPTPVLALTGLTLDGADVRDAAVRVSAQSWRYTVPSSVTGVSVAWVLDASNAAGTDTVTGAVTVPGDITSPDAFAASDWSAVPGGDGVIELGIAALPSANNGTITDIEYRLDGGPALSSGGTGGFTLRGLPAGDTAIALRAVNEAGAPVLRGPNLEDESPDFFTRWDGTLAISDNTVFATGRDWRFTVGPGSDPAGMFVSSARAGWTGAENADLYHIDIWYTLASGAISGARVIFDWETDGPANAFRVSLPFTDMEISGSPGGVQRASATLPRPAGFTGSFTRHDLFVMANFGSAAEVAAKDITFHRVALRAGRPAPWSDTRTVTVTAPSAPSAPALTLTSFDGASDTAHIEADQDGMLHWALVSGPGWSYGPGGFSGPDIRESGDAGSFTVAGGAQSFAPDYTVASATARTLLIGITNANGQDTVAAAFQPNLPPAQMDAPALTVDGATQITVTLAAAPEGYENGVSGYDLRHSTDGVNWTTVTGVTSPHALTDLAPAAQYSVQTRGINADGAGAWSLSATATTPAAAGGGGIAPVYLGSEHRNAGWTESDVLFSGLLPDADSFLVFVAGNNFGGALSLTAGGPSVSAASVIAEQYGDNAYVGAFLVTTTGAGALALSPPAGGMPFDHRVFVYRVSGAAGTVFDGAGGFSGETPVALADVPAGAGVLAVSINMDLADTAATDCAWSGDLSAVEDAIAAVASGQAASVASLANDAARAVSTTPAFTGANPGAPWASLLVAVLES